MKKTISVLSGIILIFCLMTGCNKKADEMQNSTSQMTEDAKEKAKTAIDKTKDKVTNTIDKSKFIGEDKAKQLAIERAGITAEGVIFDRVKLKNDDGIWEYEVEFKKENVEYDVTINATDGKILSLEEDSRN